jgi:hypothetical protein
MTVGIAREVTDAFVFAPKKEAFSTKALIKGLLGPDCGGHAMMAPARDLRVR